MRRYAADSENSQALDWLNGCKWLTRGLVAVTILVTANLYVTYCWNSAQWAYWLGFYGEGAVVSVWQIYRFFPPLMLRKHLREGSILRLHPDIIKVKWRWDGMALKRVEPYNRHLLQQVCNGVLGSFCTTQRYFTKRPSKAELEALLAEGEWL